MSERYRIELDSLGELRVTAQALYGAQTQRAMENYPISELRRAGLWVTCYGRTQKFLWLTEEIIVFLPVVVQRERKQSFIA